jgi:DNA polymerase III subunit delta'
MENEKINIKNGWPLAGNRQIADFLEKSAVNGKIANTYIFLGPEDLGKTATAIFFAQSLLCHKQKAGVFSFPCGTCLSCQQMRNHGGADAGFETLHSDFHLLKKDKDKKNISIEQIREFIRILEMSSFFNSYKIGIIKDADNLSESAANALLKTLEEPRPKVVVILTASRLEKIPATIISRSQILRFSPVKSSIIYDYLVDDLQCPRTSAKDFARLAAGRPALAAKFFADREFYQSYADKAENFLEFFSGNINERFNAVEKIINNETDEEKVKNILNVFNIWRGVIRDFLLLATNNGDLIRHEPWRERLEKISAALSKSKLLKINILLETGEKYVRANVNPRLVLENIAINI